jgi:hypothetical protein
MPKKLLPMFSSFPLVAYQVSRILANTRIARILMTDIASQVRDATIPRDVQRIDERWIAQSNADEAHEQLVRWRVIAVTQQSQVASLESCTFRVEQIEVSEREELRINIVHTVAKCGNSNFMNSLTINSKIDNFY